VLLVVDQNSEDLKLMLTKEIGVMTDLLQKAGYKVVVATAAGSTIDAGGNVTLKPDLKIADVKPEDYAGFVFPCMGRDMEITQPADQLALAVKAVASGKPVAAQVGGVQVLDQAGVLKGKHVAMATEGKAVVADAVWDGEGVVQDGNIITSGICPYLSRELGRPDHTAELTQKLIAALGGSR
jgi:putative intracellular protease/amidase